MNLRLWLAIVAVTTTGCPSDQPVDSADETAEGGEADETAEGGEPLTEVPLAEFFAQAEEAHCAWQVRCSGYGGPERCKSVTHYETGVSIGQLAGIGSYDRLTPDYVGVAVEVGRIEYDEEAAALCLNYAAARTCEYDEFHAWTDEERAGQAACLAVFNGRMGKNGPCATALECAEEAICGFDPSCTDMCCPGACRVLAAPVPVGQPCPTNPNVSCEAGSQCSFDPDSGMSLCTALTEVGQNCDFTNCVETATCACGPNGCRCESREDEGSACQYPGECLPGLECVRPENLDVGECVRPVDEGEECVPTFDGDITCRRFDNYCHPVDRVCVTKPGNGDGCENVGCRGDFFCAPSLGYKCSPVADEGEPCDYNGSEYVPCSGDNNCSYENDSPVCRAPSGDHCPVPEDPLGG